MNDLFTPAERSAVLKIELRAARYHLSLLKAAAKAGRIPSAKAIILRSFDRAYRQAFADFKR